jgi:prepilin-type N-terminal cleavage/methylation domain-containing protein
LVTVSVGRLFRICVSILIGTTSALGDIEMIKRKGFTLIELVVVVMILGILAAVAAPKLLNTTGAATDSGVKQTLAVVRDAIERYAADRGGQLPADPSTDLLPDYLRGSFPECPVGEAPSAARAQVATTTGAGISADATPLKGWKYSTDEGEFIINSSTQSSDGTPYDDF